MVLEQYISIDNVCAWPVLLKDPCSNDLYTIIHNSPSHGWKNGDLDCYKSSDNGRSWNYQGTPAPAKKNENRIHISAGWDNQNKLVVLSNGFKPNLKEETRGTVRGIWTSTSEDYGKTWNIHKKTTGAAPYPDQIPFGRIHQIGSDKLITTFYRPTGSDSSETWSGVSSDNGRSWTHDTALVNERDGNESTIVPLGNNHWLAATRTHIDHHLDISRSTNNAKSWSRESAITLGNQHPGDLTLLNNGNILLTYAVRNSGMTGISYRLSKDNGETWLPPKSIIQLPEAQDFGYPSTIENDNNEFTTVYYSNHSPAHNRYHMGTVIWEI